MTVLDNRSFHRISMLATLLGSAAMLAACAAPQPKSMVGGKARSKEYFAESEYGVKASPRVTNKRSRLPRGGGRDQTGKPYKVKGKWYYPKEERNYRKVGAASWYGDAFHGRLTANGEIYDMTHLTGAHPTMPLPSYARVTNKANGSSVIVRINDRGPYAHGRIVDLSKRAAEMLDYTHTGVAKVEVSYIGRAPLEGSDDRYLMASYKPGRIDGPNPGSDGLPDGVMIAMNGPTPLAGGAGAAPFPGELTTVSGTPFGLADMPTGSVVRAGAPDVALPVVGPAIPERPGGLYVAVQSQANPLSFADERMGRATEMVQRFAAGGLTPDAVERSWRRTHGANGVADAGSYVAVGTYATAVEAEAIAGGLSAVGRVEIEASRDGGRDWFTLTARGDGPSGTDRILEQAWASGAADAMIVRD